LLLLFVSFSCKKNIKKEAKQTSSDDQTKNATQTPKVKVIDLNEDFYIVIDNSYIDTIPKFETIDVEIRFGDSVRLFKECKLRKTLLPEDTVSLTWTLLLEIKDIYT